MSNQYITFKDYYSAQDDKLSSVEHRVAGASGVHLIKAQHDRGAFPDPGVPEFVLQMLLSPGPLDGRFDLGSGRFAASMRAGDALLAPPDTDCFYEAAGSFSLLITSIPAHVFAAIAVDHAGCEIADLSELHAGKFRDPALAHLCRRMWDEARHGNPHGSLYADGTVIAMCGLLLSKAGLMRPGVSAVGPVGDRRLLRAVDLMHDRLDYELGVEDLAREAGMSMSLFARCFRKNFGETPWQYLQRIRIEKAKALLCRSGHSVLEVANLVGYANAQHFATLFRRQVGVTPTAFRRDHQI